LAHPGGTTSIERGLNDGEDRTLNCRGGNYLTPTTVLIHSSWSFFITGDQLPGLTKSQSR